MRNQDPEKEHEQTTMEQKQIKHNNENLLDQTCARKGERERELEKIWKCAMSELSN